jgi:hypothetical protein
VYCAGCSESPARRTVCWSSGTAPRGSGTAARTGYSVLRRPADSVTAMAIVDRVCAAGPRLVRRIATTTATERTRCADIFAGFSHTSAFAVRCVDRSTSDRRTRRLPPCAGVYEAVDRGDPDAANGRANFRVRVPGGELRAREHAEGGARGRAIDRWALRLRSSQLKLHHEGHRKNAVSSAVELFLNTGRDGQFSGRRPSVVYPILPAATRRTRSH